MTSNRESILSGLAGWAFHPFVVPQILIIFSLPLPAVVLSVFAIDR